VDPRSAAQSGARLAADEGRAQGGVSQAAAPWSLQLQPAGARKQQALARMEVRAAQQGGFVVDVPAGAAARLPEPTMDASATRHAAPGQPLKGAMAMQGGAAMVWGGTPASYGGIPIELDPQVAAAPRQQLSAIPGGKGAAAPQHAVARAFVDTLAAMVERKVAADEEARELKTAAGAGAWQQGKVAGEQLRLGETRARGTERRLIRELDRQVHTIRKDITIMGVPGPA